ncbi:ATP-binding cassette domain-containing protein [Rubrobacter marinus]|uniref:ATP-binding cassette domain-containing protein n=1 Tax=Rubrobacter marinus TaxID=2653852 RepID=A0A6G8PV95_9ACTN|nr:ATP-binding cassette domain-containing protein [Rubrobacter marinus]QIN78103.1 ATP-binding cassette domain-containing protein [Rubrobacter marinus]
MRASGRLRGELRVGRGEYVGVVGPNGGGKSTLVRLLNGLLVADEGRVRVAGLDPAVEPFEVRKRLGMLFQNPENGLVAPFVEDDVAFGLENLGVAREEMRARVAEAIRAVGLKGYERREPHTLSGGEKQRVALAGVLAGEPEILVLDEPTSMLDGEGRREVLERVHALRGTRTILHVTHHLEEILDADRVLVVNAGRLVADVSPRRLLSDAELLRENRLVLPTVLRLGAGLGMAGPGASCPGPGGARACCGGAHRGAAAAGGGEGAVRVELREVGHVYAPGRPWRWWRSGACRSPSSSERCSRWSAGRAPGRARWCST